MIVCSGEGGEKERRSQATNGGEQGPHRSHCPHEQRGAQRSSETIYCFVRGLVGKADRCALSSLELFFLFFFFLRVRE